MALYDMETYVPAWVIEELRRKEQAERERAERSGLYLPVPEQPEPAPLPNKEQQKVVIISL